MFLAHIHTLISTMISKAETESFQPFPLDDEPLRKRYANTGGVILTFHKRSKKLLKVETTAVLKHHKGPNNNHDKVMQKSFFWCPQNQSADHEVIQTMALLAKEHISIEECQNPHHLSKPSLHLIQQEWTNVQNTLKTNGWDFQHDHENKM